MAPSDRYKAAAAAMEEAQVRYVAARERFEAAVSERRLDDVPALRLAVAEAERAMHLAFDLALAAHRACLRAQCAGVPTSFPKAELVLTAHRFWRA